jgi:SNF2 family DNA or RNA helicase
MNGFQVDPLRVAVLEVGLHFEVRALPAWHTHEQKEPQPIWAGLFKPALVEAASLALAPPKVAVSSFALRPVRTVECNAAPPPRCAAAGAARPGSAVPGRRHTRFQPPRDAVKLRDRLQYLLEPSLETILGTGELRLPFNPFGFQLEGVAFLYPRVSAVLADEMGLGKTMQSITAVRMLLAAGEIRTVLLVCPKPLVSNWLREFELWAPEVAVTSIEGDPSRRRWQWGLDDCPVRLANYELVQRDRDLIAETAARFDLVLLDEAQRIKNHASATAQSVRSIQRSRSWALTGTPIENSTQDLVGIFEFVAPGHLRPEMRPRKLGRLAGDYVLRRTKDEVLSDLPPRLVRDAQVELTCAQRETYRLAEEEGLLRLSGLGDAVTIRHVLELVLRLKQICNFDPATGESAKLERLSADLEEVVQSRRKAVVFSQWVSTLELLADRLQAYAPLIFHGRVSQREREAVLGRFRDDAGRQLLLISYGAGGVGLNLQFASYVFLFDRWWNPAVEDQAINRAHRIGAAGPVTVTRFLVGGTIEERIDQILREKRELFDAVLAEAGACQHFGLSQEELFGLFSLSSPAGKLRRCA